jgi:hypothetical protein
VIIGDLHLIRASIFPDEAEAIAVVDPNAVPSGAVVFQCLQGIAGRTDIVKSPGGVKLKQFSNRNFLDRLKLPRSHPRRRERSSPSRGDLQSPALSGDQPFETGESGELEKAAVL